MRGERPILAIRPPHARFLGGVLPAGAAGAAVGYPSEVSELHVGPYCIWRATGASLRARTLKRLTLLQIFDPNGATGRHISVSARRTADTAGHRPDADSVAIERRRRSGYLIATSEMLISLITLFLSRLSCSTCSGESSPLANCDR